MTTPNTNFPDIRPASDCSLLVTFGTTIDRQTHQMVRTSLHILSGSGLNGATNLHPAYSSILISFDPRLVDRTSLEERVRTLLAEKQNVTLPDEPIIDIPVCYEDEFSPDLHDVATSHGLTPSEVVQKHTAVTYLVYFLGFSPGFPYLGDLPDDLATPRLSTPRTKTPAGSVAIGGKHTGIYPLDSPGGWRIIGRTPRKLFFPGKNPPVLLQMGMPVRFVPITKSEYSRMMKEEA